jgi:hypothetical protein
MQYLHKNILVIFTCLVALCLVSFSHVYAEETYFEISFDRSIGIVPPDGKKSITDTGDSVTLNKKGRLWLTGNETQDGFVEIVCQNLSTEPVVVELTDKKHPWVNITGPGQCSDWQKDILICPAGNMPKGVFCKIAERIASGSGEGTKKLLSASVNIRSINVRGSQESDGDEQQYLQERVEFYAVGINLCGIIYNKTGNIYINWIIYDGGTVDKVEIDSLTASEDNPIANCIAEQIPLWKFPEWENDSQISYQF